MWNNTDIRIYSYLFSGGGCCCWWWWWWWWWCQWGEAVFKLRPSPIRYMNMETRWNDGDRGKSKNPEKPLSQCHSVRHKPHMEGPGRETWPPRWEASDYKHDAWHGYIQLLVVYLMTLWLHTRGSRTVGRLRGEGGASCLYDSNTYFERNVGGGGGAKIKYMFVRHFARLKILLITLYRYWLRIISSTFCRQINLEKYLLAELRVIFV
jgi:hypothetical protein